MRKIGRIVATMGTAGIVLAGCAQPGQLGSPSPSPAASSPAVREVASTPVATPPPVPTPGLIATGLVEERITVRTPGTAVVEMRTEVLAPGASTGWVRHPGTTTAIVRSGSVTVARAEDCAGTRHSPGEAVFVPDAEPYLARNTGATLLELVVTYVLDPDAPRRETVRSPC